MGGVLPNLLIAGAPKAGTTSLFKYLAQHPDVCAATAKEIRYFKILRYEEGPLPSIESYKAYFAHCSGEKYAMEATPMYCYGGRRMLETIKRMLDHPRIIISLRDPVERLWSAYTFQRTKGNLSEPSFEPYIEICMERRHKGQRSGASYGGLSIGVYADWLEGWFDVFEADVKIVFAERFFAEPRAGIIDISRWLDIDDVVAESFDYDARNKTAHARSIAFSRSAHAVKGKADQLLTRMPAGKERLRRIYKKINTTEVLEERLSPQMRELLEDFYAPSNAAVALLLKGRGYDRLPSWLEREVARAGD